MSFLNKLRYTLVVGIFAFIQKRVRNTSIFSCIKSCAGSQKMPESVRIPVLFLFTLHKAPSLALFSCNGRATLEKGPKTQSPKAIIGNNCAL